MAFRFNQKIAIAGATLAMACVVAASFQAGPGEKAPDGKPAKKDDKKDPKDDICKEKYTHPYPQFRPTLDDWTKDKDGTVIAHTATTCFDRVDPFGQPPGSNFLKNVDSDMFDSFKVKMPNTLPSTKARPYNLHAEEPIVEPIDPASPTDDLQDLFDRAFEAVTKVKVRDIYGQPKGARDKALADLRPDRELDPHRLALRELARRGIDILEGNPVLGRAYSGFPLLHYNGPNKNKEVEVVRDKQTGNVMSGNVNVHQIWYDNHIESDTSLLDVRTMSDPTEGGVKWSDAPWTITYTIDVLRRGEDDFSPFTMLFDDPYYGLGDKRLMPMRLYNRSQHDGGRLDRKKVAKDRNELQIANLAHVGMDQTFFPLKEGTRTVLKIKMPPAKYYSLTYTWGWRQHPPRVQSMEMTGKKLTLPGDTKEKGLLEFETDAFGLTPTASVCDQRKAIDKIADIAPAKRMWTCLRAAAKALEGNNDYSGYIAQVEKARRAFFDWRNRRKLPSGVPVDHETDLTLLFVNNTIYAEQRDGGVTDFPGWRTRGTQVKVTIYNADYFPHGYINIDFGGMRGWENQFKPAEGLGGSGCLFSFGRAHWFKNMKTPVVLTEADSKKERLMLEDDPKTVRQGLQSLPKQRVFLTFHFEPSRRLRFYQFDPFHHDVAIFSLH